MATARDTNVLFIKVPNHSTKRIKIEGKFREERINVENLASKGDRKTSGRADTGNQQDLRNLLHMGKTFRPAHMYMLSAILEAERLFRIKNATEKEYTLDLGILRAYDNERRGIIARREMRSAFKEALKGRTRRRAQNSKSAFIVTCKILANDKHWVVRCGFIVAICRVFMPFSMRAGGFHLCPFPILDESCRNNRTLFHQFYK